MGNELSARQRELLKAIIELHVRTGEPVGSENVDKEFTLGVSPATIRNEMAALTEGGFLKQPHTSAGRVPTTMAYRLYIDQLMKEKAVPVSSEVSIKEAIWTKRHEEERLLQETVRILASKCGLLALAIDDKGEVYYAGTANILDWVEFEDIDLTRFVLGLFDQYPMLNQLVGKVVANREPIHVLFGDELGVSQLDPIGFVFSRYFGPDDKSGVIGVLGPARINFATVMPLVRYTGQALSEALNSW